MLSTGWWFIRWKLWSNFRTTGARFIGSWLDDGAVWPPPPHPTPLCLAFNLQGRVKMFAGNQYVRQSVCHFEQLSNAFNVSWSGGTVAFPAATKSTMPHLLCYSKTKKSFNKAVKKIFVNSTEWHEYGASVQFSQLLSRKMSWCQ